MANWMFDNPPDLEDDELDALVEAIKAKYPDANMHPVAKRWVVDFRDTRSGLEFADEFGLTVVHQPADEDVSRPANEPIHYVATAGDMGSVRQVDASEVPQGAPPAQPAPDPDDYDRHGNYLKQNDGRTNVQIIPNEVYARRGPDNIVRTSSGQPLPMQPRQSVPYGAPPPNATPAARVISNRQTTRKVETKTGDITALRGLNLSEHRERAAGWTPSPTGGRLTLTGLGKLVASKADGGVYVILKFSNPDIPDQVVTPQGGVSLSQFGATIRAFFDGLQHRINQDPAPLMSASDDPGMVPVDEAWELGDETLEGGA